MVAVSPSVESLPATMPELPVGLWLPEMSSTFGEWNLAGNLARVVRILARNSERQLTKHGERTHMAAFLSLIATRSPRRSVLSAGWEVSAARLQSRGGPRQRVFTREGVRIVLASHDGEGLWQDEHCVVLLASGWPGG